MKKERAGGEDVASLLEGFKSLRSNLQKAGEQNISGIMTIMDSFRGEQRVRAKP